MRISMEAILFQTNRLLNKDLQEGTLQLSSQKLQKIRTRLVQIQEQTTKFINDD